MPEPTRSPEGPSQHTAPLQFVGIALSAMLAFVSLSRSNDRARVPYQFRLPSYGYDRFVVPSLLFGIATWFWLVGVAVCDLPHVTSVCALKQAVIGKPR